ncbi:DNA binding protein [Aureococcus anophagefferens]|nr:DNA binding protein [Aureococcus anophagefferens]
MTFDFCVDGCDEDITVGPYYDGSSYNVTGDASYYNEYVYVDRATEDLVVSAVGYGSGTGTLSVLYDCPGTCCTCAAATTGTNWANSLTEYTYAGMTFDFCVDGCDEDITRALRLPGHVLHLRRGDVRAIAGALRDPDDGGADDRGADDDADDSPAVGRAVAVPDDGGAVGRAVGRADDVHRRPGLCVYTDAVAAYAIDVVQGETQNTGTNWANSLTEYTYAGMTFDFCVDGCDEDITVGPYYDGSSYNVTGDASYYNEYVYVDRATEDLVVSAVGYGSGTGTLSVLYDCPGTCCTCAAATTGTNWANSLTEYTYAGMTFDFCVDGCGEDITVGPYYDGAATTSPETRPTTTSTSTSTARRRIWSSRRSATAPARARSACSTTARHVLHLRRGDVRAIAGALRDPDDGGADDRGADDDADDSPAVGRAVAVPDDAGAVDHAVGRATTRTVDPVFASTPTPWTAYAIDVVQGETQEVFAIPASQRRTWIQLDATADIDLKLETSGGVVLLDYSTGTNWANSLTEYTYAGMTFDFCVDGCDEDITVGPYYDGSSYNVTGDASYYNEYVYVDRATEDLVVSARNVTGDASYYNEYAHVDRATEDLVVSAVGYGSGTGTLSVLRLPGHVLHLRRGDVRAIAGALRDPTTAAPTTAGPTTTPTTAPPSAAPSLFPTTPAPSTTPSVAPTRTVDPVFCVYTDAVTAYAIDVVQGETQEVFAIPASQRRTWIQLDATADIDLKLRLPAARASGLQHGHELGEFVDGVHRAGMTFDFCVDGCGEDITVGPTGTNWANSLTEYTYAGMTFDFCVDGCDEDITVGPYYDGAANVTGDASYYNVRVTRPRDGGSGRLGGRLRLRHGHAQRALRLPGHVLHLRRGDVRAIAGALRDPDDGGADDRGADDDADDGRPIPVPHDSPAVGRAVAVPDDGGAVGRAVGRADDRRTWIQLDATADIDLKLETSDGVVLLDYSTATNWANSLTEYTYAGMTFDFCVDGCDEDITVGPYYDGSSYDVVGSSSYFNEYVYVDRATEDLVVSAVGYGSGTGTLSVLYDCPGTCCTCAAATSAPSPAPSSTPTTAALSLGPTTSRPTFEILTSLVYARALAATLNVSVARVADVACAEYERTRPPSALVEDRVYWADRSVAPFDCETHYEPIQVLKYEGAATYSVREFSLADGAYDLLYDIDYFDGHVNAVALYDGGASGYYALGSFGGYLCRFDNASAICSATPLALASPNVGAIVGNDFYYAKNLGDDGDEAVYVVKDVNTDDPEFVDAARFAVSPELFQGTVLDLAAVEEDEDDLVVDGDAGTYLVGLGFGFEVLVVRVAADGLADAYAVVNATVDWDGYDATAAATGFGAAFAYVAGGTRLFFASNEGQGLFELMLPVAVPAECWNAGFDVLRYEGAATYSVREFSLTTGAYDLVYDLGWFDGHVNAVALLDGGSYGYYAVGSFDGYLCRRPALFEGSVLDVAVIEEAGDELVDDGDDGGTYLVGLGFGLEVLVVRIDAVGYPVAYAVLNATVDWGGAERGTTGFGAAFAYVLEDSTRLFFASNEGEGLFELTLPVTVPPECWNVGFDLASHAVCGEEGAYVSRLAAAAAATSNDGMNCPGGAASWIAARRHLLVRPVGRPFDCEAHGNPVQVLKYDGADAYSVREFDLDSGSYTLVYDLDYVDGHVNAVALLDGGSYGYYAVGSFDGYLCRFDNASSICAATPLELSTPNVGAIVGSNYYYAKNVGDDGGEVFYWVAGVNSDAPTFVSDYLFAVSSDLFEGSVLDVAAFEEDDEELVDDGDDHGTYLVGLGFDFEVLVVRVAETGYPLSYAVLPSSVDAVDDDNDDYADDTAGFGAAFAYADGGATRLFFAERRQGPSSRCRSRCRAQVRRRRRLLRPRVRPGFRHLRPVYDLDWFDGHVNAVALLDGGSYGYYAVGSFDGYLCRFDDAVAVCATTPLELDAERRRDRRHELLLRQNVGDEDDEVFYWVADIHTDEPTFYGDYEFAVASDLFEGTVLDVAVVEEAGDEMIDDGDDEGTYLVGLGFDFEVLVVRIAASGYPDAYAVLESDVDADDDDKLDDTAGFGAAFAYVDGDATRLFFASNGGAGLFELELPITVPSECWNAGTDADDAVRDADDAEISRVSDAAEASSNDGMNCPDGGVDEDRRRARRRSRRRATAAPPRAANAPPGPTVVPTAALTVLPTSGVFSVIHATVEYETAGGASAPAARRDAAAEAPVAAGEFYVALEDAAEDLDLVVEIVAVGDVAAVVAPTAAPTTRDIAPAPTAPSAAPTSAAPTAAPTRAPSTRRPTASPAPTAYPTLERDTYCRRMPAAPSAPSSRRSATASASAPSCPC